MGDLNAAGNHRKNMVRAVEASLRRLNTDYIDLYWLHAWDGTTPADEVMRALDDLVRSGKILHIGVSDTPAWMIARCNTMAEIRGWTSFVGLQADYSLVRRDAERDLIPMAKEFGMTLLPWSPLGAGVLTGKYLSAVDHSTTRLKATSPRLSETNLAIASVVAEIAEACATTSVRVALAWIRQQQPGAIPILGVRNVEQLDDALGCIDVQLNEDHMSKLNAVSAIAPGFPHEFLASDNIQNLMFAGMGAQLNKR
jgi:aryl-alcohol dehydrogenase-like predicted oxidoreductase